MASEKYVALDIGTSSVKAIEAVVSRGSIKITRVYTLPIQSEVVSSGKVVAPELLTTALRRLWREGRFSTRNVALLASGYEQSTDRVFPKLPWSSTHEDFKVFLPTYMKNSPDVSSFYEEDKYYVDEHTLNEYIDERDGKRYKKSLVTFLAREYVDSLVTAAESVKLLPIKMDTLPFCLIRAFAHANMLDSNEIVVSVDIGASATNVTIHKNGQPISIQTVDQLGGRRITERIARGLGVSFAEAEFLKIALSVTREELSNLARNIVLAEGVDRNLTLESFSEDAIAKAINIISQEVSHLISNVNDVLYDTDNLLTEEESFSRIVVSGGTAKLRTLTSRLEAELEIKTELLNTFANARLPRIKGNVGENLQAYAGVYGLLVGKHA